MPETLLAEDSLERKEESLLSDAGGPTWGRSSRRPLQQERGDVKRLTEELPMHSATTEAQSFLSPLLWVLALLAAAVFIFIEQASRP